MEVAFENLKEADLVVDTIYKGGTASGKASEVLSKLMPGCSNSGGFRKVMRKDGSGLPAFVVLYTSMRELAWPDYLDEETGIFRYYGDNRNPGRTILDTPRKGNLLLEFVFECLNSKDVKDENQKLQVFQRGSVYLATKKIGKRNPKALEIDADNRKRQEWNRAVDMALISGIQEPQIMEVKQKRISEPIKSAISRKGRKPNLFAKVVAMAIETLELMIETVLVKKYKESLEQKEQLQKTDASDMESVMPETERTEVEIKEPVERQPEPKQPEMTRLASKYPRFFKINNELEQQNNAIYKKEKQRATKKKELSEIKGWFKGRKKKELQEEIDDLTSQIRNMKDYLPKIVQKVGYRSVQEFLKDFKTAKSEYNQYQKAIAQWQQETGKEPEPQPHGVRAKLAANRKKIEQEQKNTQRTQNQSKDRGAR